MKYLLCCLLCWGSVSERVAGQDDVEFVGTFYDVTTHEYLTLNTTGGRVRIGYSAGSKPFVPLIVVKEETPDEPGLRAVYTVAFAGSPKTTYVLKHWINERAGIDCYDAADQRLNQYSFVTNLIQPRPALIHLLYGMYPKYQADGGPVLRIDPADETYAIRLEYRGVEHDLRVRSERLATNEIEFINAEGHGPFVVRLFRGIRYRTPGLDADRIELVLPGGAVHVLVGSTAD